MSRLILSLSLLLLFTSTQVFAQQYRDSNGRLRIALVKQPFTPTGTSTGPQTMANGGIRQVLEKMGAVVRVAEVGLTTDE